jgi:hypothetical protein
MAREDYSSLRIKSSVAEDFRRLIRRIAADADRDVSQSDALGALLALGLEHVAEVTELLGRADA